jgi:hypothetical protein
LDLLCFGAVAPVLQAHCRSALRRNFGSDLFEVAVKLLVVLN